MDPKNINTAISGSSREICSKEDKKKKISKNKKKDACRNDAEQQQCLGILSFEVARMMFKAVHLWRSLSDKEMKMLRNLVIKSEAINYLVSEDESYLLGLACAEKLDELGTIAGAVARLGRRCREPALQGFEHVYRDLYAGKIDSALPELIIHDMDKKTRKMERSISATAELHQEMEALAEREKSLRRLARNLAPESSSNSNNAAAKANAFQHKISWQQRHLKRLREASLWNQGFDKITGLLARTVCTIFCRICCVFGGQSLELSLINSGSSSSSAASPASSASASASASSSSSSSSASPEEKHRLPSWLPQKLKNSASQDLPLPPPLRISECLNWKISKPLRMMSCDGLVFRGTNNSSSFISSSSSTAHFNRASKNFTLSANGGYSGPLYKNPLFAKTNPDPNPNPNPISLQNTRIPAQRSPAKLIQAPATTLGGSALALHYAHLVMLIEKLVRFPHLIAHEYRDDLYQMLPESLRRTLRTRLKSYAKKLAFGVLDGPLASDWKDVLEKILGWLAPLAHNTIQWQAEHNFEHQQQIVSRSNILLLQTLYFADQAKTEATVVEILVGLNYIYRYEQENRASVSVCSSQDSDDLLEWHFS